MRATWICIGAAAALLGLGQPVAAQPPSLTNGRISRQPAEGALETQVRRLIATAAEPTWIGWLAPARKPDAGNCCWNSINGVTLNCGCQLEGNDSRTVGTGTASVKSINLEAGQQLVMLIRTEDHLLQRVAFYSDACALDAGGRPVVWLDGVQPGASVTLLASLAAETESDGRLRRTANSAMAALAQHAVAGADSALIELAKNNTSAKVRSQALFWVAQRAGDKALGTIAAAIQSDPDLGVKKQAVFALSQLPKDDGVPKLIEVARTNKNPEVRKQAMFWLGQSHDPRALRYFEEILTK